MSLENRGITSFPFYFAVRGVEHEKPLLGMKTG